MEEEESEAALVPILADSHHEFGWSRAYMYLYFPQPPTCDLQCLLGFKLTAENWFYNSSTEFWAKDEGKKMSFLLPHKCPFLDIS